MKKFVLFFYFVAIVAMAQSQTPSLLWTKGIWSAGKTGIYPDKSVAVDANKNVYIAGYYNDSADFNPGPVINLSYVTPFTSNAFILKLDELGAFVWFKKIGDDTTRAHICSIKLDGSGNIYLLGMFAGILDFDPGIGVFYLSSIGITNGFVLKLDPSGNFIWAKAINGNMEVINSTLEIDPAGNICLSGYFSGTTDFDPGTGVVSQTSVATSYDIFILKLDTAGSFLWVKTMGSAFDDRATSIASDAAGNIYSTGYFQDSIDFDPGPGLFYLNSNSTFSYDLFILKIDPSGNFIWAKRIGGSSNEFGSSIDVDLSGNVYSTGLFTGVVDFDPGPGIFNLSTGHMFVSKLDNSGNFIWAKGIDASPNAIVLDAQNNVYTTGTFVGTVDFDPGSGIINLIGNSTIWNDAFISKLDASGNFDWAVNLGGTSVINGYSITVDPSYNVYTCGVYFGLIDFDPGSGIFNLPDNEHDIFIHKMQQETSTKTNEFTEQNLIGVFPNPAKNSLRVHSKKTIQNIKIINLLGEIVYSNQRVEQSNYNIDLSALSRGFYFIHFEFEEVSVSMKIIKE